MTALGGARPLGTSGAGGGGGAVTLPAWSALPAGTEGDVVPATLGGVAITARRAAQIYHPAYPTKAQLTALWPASDQSPGLRIGPMSAYHQGIAEQIPFKIMWQGDSTIGGQGATGGSVGCRPYSFVNLMAAEFGWRDGMAFSQLINNSDPRVSQGGWTASVLDALGGAWESAGGQDLVFTPGIPCDAVIVTGLGVFGVGGTSNVYVDNVLVGVIQHNSAVSGVNLPQVQVSVERGLHTIKVTSVGQAWINSFETFDSLSTAPELYQCGVANARLTNLTATTGGYSAAQRILQIRPRICVVGASINDLDNNDSIATVKTRMTALRDMHRANGTEFIGLVSWATNRPNISQAELDELYTHQLSLGQSALTGAADLRGSMGDTFAATNPLYYVDDWHFSQLGNVVAKDHYKKLWQ